MVTGEGQQRLGDRDRPETESSTDRDFAGDLRRFIVTSRAGKSGSRPSSLARPGRGVSLRPLGRLPLRVPLALRLPRARSKKALIAVLLLLPLMTWLILSGAGPESPDGRKAIVPAGAKAKIAQGVGAITGAAANVAKGITGAVGAVTEKAASAIGGNSDAEETVDTRGAAGKKGPGKSNKRQSSGGEGTIPNNPAAKGGKGAPAGEIQGGPQEKPLASAQAGAKSGKQPRPILNERRVVPGDTLREIAQREYGDEMLWPLIWDYNKQRAKHTGQNMVNPDLIYPGWTFIIPKRSAEK